MIYYTLKRRPKERPNHLPMMVKKANHITTKHTVGCDIKEHMKNTGAAAMEVEVAITAYALFKTLWPEIQQLLYSLKSVPVPIM